MKDLRTWYVLIRFRQEPIALSTGEVCAHDEEPVIEVIWQKRSGRHGEWWVVSMGLSKETEYFYTEFISQAEFETHKVFLDLPVLPSERRMLTVKNGTPQVLTRLFKIRIPKRLWEK